MDLLQCYDSSSSNDEGTIERGKVKISHEKVSGIRQQQHIDGNWAGLCYHSIPAQAIDVSLRDEHIRQICTELETAGYSGHCQVHDEFHISLSRPFYLQEANLQPFVNALSQRIRESSIRRFRVNIESKSPTILTNDEHTRSFLVWNAQANELQDVVQQCDQILGKYLQPEYYRDPEFHVSLASFIPAIGSKARRKVSQMVASSRKFETEENDQTTSTSITTLSVKFGTTKIFVLGLL